MALPGSDSPMNADIPSSQLNNNNNSECEQRKNISILFIGFMREKAATIQAALQNARMAPRCRLIANEKELTGSLSERSWDLILLSNDQPQDLSFARSAAVMKNLDKDIPLLLLCRELPDAGSHLELLEQGVAPASAQVQELNAKLNEAESSFSRTWAEVDETTRAMLEFSLAATAAFGSIGTGGTTDVTTGTGRKLIKELTDVERAGQQVFNNLTVNIGRAIDDWKDALRSFKDFFLQTFIKSFI